MSLEAIKPICSQNASWPWEAWWRAFLRRFCQHVLPRGFVRIRHFGYLASAHRTSLLALARQQFDCQPLPSSHLANSPLAIWRCPRCGANMNVGPNLTAQQLVYRCKLTDFS